MSKRTARQVNLKTFVKHFYRWIFVVPAGVVAVIIAIANRHAAIVVFDPFSPDAPSLSIDLPLFVIIFTAIFIGMLIGGGVAWSSGAGTRKKARSYRRQVRGLEKARDEAPPANSVPALPDAHSG